ncbi:MAG: methylmalonyl-CoA epimerase [Nitrospirae bacterium]|nr:methylmalonyl-CoA epimerase [Nitrospirota bacterium]
MFRKIDHIGIAVPNLAEALRVYRDTLGFTVDHQQRVEDQQVTTAFIPVGGTHLELLEPTSPDSPIGKFLAKRGAGLHHVAIAVDDIEAAIRDYTSRGIRMIDPKPRLGAHGKKIAFVHPKSTGGILLELCETPEK